MPDDDMTEATTAETRNAARAYFAYGSNLHPARMAARLARPRLIGTAVLAAHALRFDKRGRDGSGKCTIEPATDACVHGAVYHLTADDEQRLDIIEGVGGGYDVQYVTLARHGTVRTYVANAAARCPGLPVFDWYLGLVVAGARHLGLPAPYLARLASLPCVADPDPERAALHAALLASCARHPPFEDVSRTDDCA